MALGRVPSPTKNKIKHFSQHSYKFYDPKALLILLIS